MLISYKDVALLQVTERLDHLMAPEVEIKALDLLVKNGANIFAKNAQDQTILDIVIRKQHDANQKVKTAKRKQDKAYLSENINVYDDLIMQIKGAQFIYALHQAAKLNASQHPEKKSLMQPYVSVIEATCKEKTLESKIN